MVPGGRCGEPPRPPMIVMCPILKRFKFMENSLITSFIGLLIVSLYIFLLRRLRRNLGDCLCPYSKNIYAYYLVQLLHPALLGPKKRFDVTLFYKKVTVCSPDLRRTSTIAPFKKRRTKILLS